VTRVTSCSDAEAAAVRAAAEVARGLRDAVRDRGIAHLALSGGDGPRRAYELLRDELESFRDVEVWFIDERCVPPEHEESNFRLARETLLEGAPGLASERVHRMRGELGPQEGARSYETELRKRFRAAPEAASAGRSEPMPVLDVAVLGIGPDAHVASLFPGAATLEERELLCLGVSDSPKPPPERITLSLPVLRAARRCLMLATGAEKEGAVEAMLGEPSRDAPASLLRRERLIVVLDDAADPTPQAR
jgi:6-phosphogluconolactonase